MRSTLARLLARAYLGKPDLAEFLALRVPDLPSLLSTLRNELAFRMGWHSLPRLSTLNVELTSRCNVACSYCDVNRELGRPAQDLPLELLARLLEGSPGLQTLLPFQWGEPLLYEPLDEALALASSHRLRSYLTTNGTLLDGDRMERLARSGLTRLTISLDGSASDHRARRGYDQGEILRRLAEARQARDAAGLATRIDISMVVDETVAHELGEFRARMTPLCDRVQFIPKLVDGLRTSPCREPSRGVLVVLSDGRITSCCADVRGQLNLGHVNDGSPAAIYSSAPWRELRAQHRRRAWPAICARCDECAVPGVSKRFS